MKNKYKGIKRIDKQINLICNEKYKRIKSIDKQIKPLCKKMNK